VLCAASVAHAQPEVPVHRFQLAAGIGILGGASLGDADANLRSSTSSDPYRVFTTSSRLSSAAPVLDLRAALDVTPRFGVEAHALFGRPKLQNDVSGDVENAPPVTASERLDQYLIDGGVIVTLDELRVKDWQPFAAAGAGYMRQLHQGLTLTESGHLFYVGGGARHSVIERPSGFVRGLGVRADVRLNILSGGVTVDDTSRNQFSASVSFFVVF
jgi:hypothetical protein